MIAQCAAEEKLANYVEKLSTLQLQETAPQPAPVQKQQTTIPNFEEQITDMRSNDSLIGEAVGAALTGTVGAIASRFVPNIGIPQGIVVGGLAYILGKKFFRTGITHALTRGVVIASISTVIYPFVSGIGNSLGGAPAASNEGSGMPYGV